jgi:hypothetical protein
MENNHCLGVGDGNTCSSWSTFTISSYAIPLLPVLIMASYLRIWFLALLILLTGAVTLNYWVDPYGLYRPYSEGDWKPNGATQGELVKPYLVLKHSPRTLILGNSRAEVGFDPEDTAWPKSAQPIYKARSITNRNTLERLRCRYGEIRKALPALEC